MALFQNWRNQSLKNCLVHRLHSIQHFPKIWCEVSKQSQRIFLGKMHVQTDTVKPVFPQNYVCKDINITSWGVGLGGGGVVPGGESGTWQGTLPYLSLYSSCSLLRTSAVSVCLFVWWPFCWMIVPGMLKDLCGPMSLGEMSSSGI